MKVYTCKYCGRDFEKVYSLGGHTGRCALNPKHAENIIGIRLKSSLGKEKKDKERYQKYLENPTRCNFCQKNLSYENRKLKYCNNSCAAKFTNTFRKGEKRIFSQQALENIREANNRRNQHNEKQYDENGKLIKKKWVPRFSNIIFEKCKICKKIFSTKKIGGGLTCSKECRTISIMENRDGRSIWGKKSNYFNKWMNKIIRLDSSWELAIAQLLDKKEIKWLRPKPIKWEDSLAIKHLYFPDFYLVDFGIYLEPKNKLVMIKDKEKLEIVSKQVELKSGDLIDILSFINTL